MTRILAVTFIWLSHIALASATNNLPYISRISAVAPDVISIEIQAGKRVPALQQSYSKGILDWVDDSRDRHRWIRQGKEVLGAVVGPEQDVLYPFDEFSGTKLDTRWADSASSYLLKSSADANFSNGIKPTVIYRKSRPSDMARTGFWAFNWPMTHYLYLKLPKPLKEGAQYEIEFQNSNISRQTYIHNTRNVRSEAVHVSQIGFRPDDPRKVAFLSLWRGNGDGQPYSEGLPFAVINSKTQQIVYRGKTQLTRSHHEAEDAYKQNYTGADVYVMQFDDLQTQGEYRVCVKGVGCSYNFPISQDAWRNAFATSVRGLFHQRSGIKLGPPYTQYRRPRNMHPDDGVVVYHSRTPLMDTMNGINARGTAKDNFSDLINGKTGLVVKNAWGGYADAGDWDRRIQHLNSTRLLLELAELNPQYFSKLNLNIPESGNTLPDLLDEAVWGLDLFRRLQTPEGGIRGGIESMDHPRHGEGSWQESQTLIAYAPGFWSSHIYAGVAARAARILKPYDAKLAATYEASALKAMHWAEEEYKRRAHREMPHQTRDDRNLAAAELFRLTGNESWHRLFRDTSEFQKASAPLQKWQHHDQTEAAFVYVNTPGADALIKRNAEMAILREADESIRIGQQSAFKWTKRNAWAWIGWGNLSVPGASTLVRAHYLTGKRQYLDAALLATQYGAGANPLNMVFTTGVGENSPKNPLIQDQRVSSQPPPEGITVNGPLETKRQLNHWLAKLFANEIYPRHALWPTAEAYFDVYDFAPLNEFTIQSTIGPNAYIWGYLAARK